MGIKRLNHAVLYVRDAARSGAFYSDVLGFVPAMGEEAEVMPGAVFLRAPDSTNDHDLGLFGVGAAAADSAAGRGAVGLYHLAWEVRTLADLQHYAERLTAAGALVGASDHGTTKALYGKDPDGIEFEVSWLVPRTASTRRRSRPGPGSARSTSLAEIARYGAGTEGGVGVSSRASAG